MAGDDTADQRSGLFFGFERESVTSAFDVDKDSVVLILYIASRR